MDKSLRGVNLGGWLVLERWITPSLFQGTTATDEYSLCEELGLATATERILRHRETFITEDHIRMISELGLSLVRLPLGYWLFGSEAPYIANADRYVDRLFVWAEKYDIKVILDFHAAPGSQNGWDHSGRAGDVKWENSEHIEKSLQFLEELLAKYGHYHRLIGVEPLNEPRWDVDINKLVDYYERAGLLINRLAHQSVSLIVSDSFRPEQMSKLLQKRKLNAVMDIHLYQLFTPEDRALDLEGHLRKTTHDWSNLLEQLSRHHRLLVGEWSAAMSELYNELGEAQRNYSRDNYVSYANAQRSSFEDHNTSWTYWTARTEDGGVWSLLDHPELIKK